MKTTDQEEPANEKTQPITAASGPVATKQVSKPLIWGAVGVIVAAGIVASYLIGYTIAKHHHRENISAIERRQGRAKSDIRSVKHTLHKTTRGVVASTSATEVTINRSGNNENATYALTTDTTILKDGQKATTADLTEGTTVEIRSVPEGKSGQRTAKIIIINPHASTRKG